MSANSYLKEKEKEDSKEKQSQNSFDSAFLIFLSWLLIFLTAILTIVFYENIYNPKVLAAANEAINESLEIKRKEKDYLKKINKYREILASFKSEVVELRSRLEGQEFRARTLMETQENKIKLQECIINALIAGNSKEECYLINKEIENK